mgnify:CR=1 FL=1
MMKIQKVNRPKGHNRYCGPAAISALTGCDTNMAALAIRLVSGQRAVRGTHPSVLLQALKKYWNIEATEVFSSDRKNRPTLAQWLKRSKEDRTAGRVFLLVAGNHYQLVSGKRYVCGISKDIVSIKGEVVKRRARVADVWEITCSGRVGLTAEGKTKLVEQPKLVAASKRKHNAELSKIRRFAKQTWSNVFVTKWDITFEHEPEFDRWYIYCPEWIDEDEDPAYDAHFAYSFEGLAYLVEEYAKHHPRHPEHHLRKFNLCAEF